ncbi:MAG: pyridoxamine 5'-phosphate oxidase [Citrobacter freundii]|nr:MAG: pyridoxamine 5'-phosphate oxidase [Citrobacter freundii]
MFGALNNEQMDQLLSQQILGRLGCHTNGLTYIVPISYAYNKNCIYCFSEEGLKLSMLRKNRNVCFQVDNTRDMSNWQSVICWGEFKELVTEEDKREALAVLNARNFTFRTSKKMQINPDWPFAGNGAENLKGVFFRIQIEDKTGRYETADVLNEIAG